METVSITIPDDVIPRVEALLRAVRPDLKDLGQAEFFRRVVADHVRAHEQAAAERQARADADVAVTQAIADLARIL